jgi:hypothetical protein
MNLIAESSTDYLDLHLCFCAMFEDYRQLFDSFVQDFVSYLPAAHIPSRDSSGSFNYHGWRQLKVTLAAWRTFGASDQAAVAAGDTDRPLTAAEKLMCEGPPVDYYEQHEVTVAGVRYKVTGDQSSCRTRNIRDSVILVESSDGQQHYGVVRKVLLFRPPGTEFADTHDTSSHHTGSRQQHSSSSQDFRDVYTEPVLLVDWFQTARNVDPRLRTPILAGGYRGPAIMSARDVARTFPCGRFVPAQHICPAANVVVRCPEGAGPGQYTVLHRDPAVTSYVGRGLRVG